MTLKKYPHAPRVVGSQNRQPTFICVPGASHHYLARIATFLRSYSHFTSSDADPPAGTPLRGGKIDGNLFRSAPTYCHISRGLCCQIGARRCLPPGRLALFLTEASKPGDKCLHRFTADASAVSKAAYLANTRW